MVRDPAVWAETGALTDCFAMTHEQLTSRKGIVLAGGTGTRLYPLTLGVSKQLLPVFDKPLVYYPLATLILAGVREVLFITTPQDRPGFARLMGDGSQWGMSFSYAEQETPRGVADAYLVAREFLDGAPSVLILGDNIFFGHGLQTMLERAGARDGGTIFASRVRDPARFGVVEMDADDRALSLEEKPARPRSNWAVTGLYFLDGAASARAATVTPSERGELEIVSVLQPYLDEGRLNVEMLHRGFTWLDAGTHESLHQAGEFVQTLQDRQGLLVCSPEELAYRQGFITLDRLAEIAQKLEKSSYGQALAELVAHEQSIC